LCQTEVEATRLRALIQTRKLARSSAGIPLRFTPNDTRSDGGFEKKAEAIFSGLQAFIRDLV
jgi:hypothetical protein